MMRTPPTIAGVALETAATGLPLLWMAVGVTAVWRARSRWTELLSHVLFTAPATFAVIFWPAVVLVLTNLLLG